MWITWNFEVSFFVLLLSRIFYCHVINSWPWSSRLFLPVFPTDSPFQLYSILLWNWKLQKIKGLSKIGADLVLEKTLWGEKAMIFKACNFCLSCWSLWNPFVSHTVFSYSLDSCNLKGKVITSVPMLARALMISRHRCECHLNSTTNS